MEVRSENNRNSVPSDFVTFIKDQRRRRNMVFYLIASHISRPIFTQFLA